MNNTIIIDVWLVVVSCNIEGQERFSKITKVGLELRRTYK